MTDDLISRKEAIRRYCADECRCDPEGCNGSEDCSCVRLLKNLPSVQPEQKHGEWTEKHVKDADWLFHRRFYCSVCGNWQTHGETDYCPNCGARMDGGTECD